MENLIFSIIRQENLILKKAWMRIAELAQASFADSGMSPENAAELWSRMENILRNEAEEWHSLSQLEGKLRKLYEKQKADPRQLYAQLLRRAERCYANIAEHLSGETLLDFGAGSGILAKTIQHRKGMQVSLVDVVNYSLTALPFYPYEQSAPLGFEDNCFDSALLYLVLHHADDPLHALKEVTRVTKRRLIIVEGEVEQPERYLVNCFLDWLHNRVVSGMDIHVPLNFQRVADWHEWFAQLGLKVMKTQLLDVDDPCAPEFHVLFVLEKTAAHTG
jgi:ubiquinone/menaquinone biosynthesis C-methylase UbiE